MGFVAIKPKKSFITTNYFGDKLKIGFPRIRVGKGEKQTEDQYINITFGKDLANKIGIKDGDKVLLHTHEDTDFVYWLTKDVGGYSVTDLSKGKPKAEPRFRLQFKWEKDIPSTFKDGSYKFCTVDVWQGGLRILLPGSTIEDRELT